jgi:hypothetical protein
MIGEYVRPFTTAGVRDFFLTALGIALFIGPAGCSREKPARETSGNADATPVPAAVHPESTSVTLHQGQASPLPTHPDDALQFVDAPQDSRCPIGVQCAWEGDATVILAVLPAGTSDTTRIELHTNKRFATTGTYKDLQIHLEKLDPYPRQGVKIALADYVATLSITR